MGAATAQISGRSSAGGAMEEGKTRPKFKENPMVKNKGRELPAMFSEERLKYLEEKGQVTTYASKDELDWLVALYQALDKNKEHFPLRDRVYECFYVFLEKQLHKAAHTYNIENAKAIDYEDLVQQAKAATINVIKKYDFEKGKNAKPTSLIMTVIKRELFDVNTRLSSSLSTSRTNFENHAELRQAEAEFIEKYGHTPSNEELAKFSGKHRENVALNRDFMIKAYGMGNIHDLVEESSGDEDSRSKYRGGDGSIEILGARHRDDVFDNAALEICLHALHPNVREFVRLYFFEHRSLKDLQEIYGLKLKDVKHILNAAVEMLGSDMSRIKENDHFRQAYFIIYEDPL
jgi:RNA polymerase sigma factor (sigma-70 family)